MAKVRVSLGGETVVVDVAEWEKEASRLHALYGGVPQVDRVDDPTPALPVAAVATAEVPASLPTSLPVSNVNPFPARAVRVEGGVSVEGAERSARDLAAAVLAGFAPKQPLYQRGTQVNETGVRNARRSRAEYEALPLLREACGALIDRVAAEHRDNHFAPASVLHMEDTGELSIEGQRYYLTPEALTQLCTRLGFGGGDYHRRCPTDLRAYNVNDWIGRFARNELPKHLEVRMPATPLCFRTRENLARGGREVFAVVSQRYVAYDVDRVSQVLADSLPQDTRGEVTYDGTRARWNALYQTTVEPENFVAGEFFRAGMSFRTADDGTGSLIGSAILFQNLCLNLIIIDRAAKETLRARHKGTEDALRDALRRGVGDSLAAIEPFLKQWGYATQRNVVQDLGDEDLIGRPVSEVIPGIFNGVLERELVRIPGPREEVVQKLMHAWEGDRSAARGPTLAGIVNAFTRYAHTAVDEDPWLEDSIQQSASALLRGPTHRGIEKPPAALPYVALES